MFRFLWKVPRVPSNEIHSFAPKFQSQVVIRNHVGTRFRCSVAPTPRLDFRSASIHLLARPSSSVATARRTRFLRHFYDNAESAFQGNDLHAPRRFVDRLDPTASCSESTTPRASTSRHPLPSTIIAVSPSFLSSRRSVFATLASSPCMAMRREGRTCGRAHRVRCFASDGRGGCSRRSDQPRWRWRSATSIGSNGNDTNATEPNETEC